VRRYTYKNKDYTLDELCKVASLPHDHIKKRLWNGWSVERAVETPLVKRGDRGFTLCEKDDCSNYAIEKTRRCMYHTESGVV
jgi:hypothetical protein